MQGMRRPARGQLLEVGQKARESVDAPDLA